MELEELKKKFLDIYGEDSNQGEIRAFFAPGRVNLMGEHIDYNGGHVFPCALTLGTYGLIRKRLDTKVRLASLNVGLGSVREFSVDEPLQYDKAADGWTGYVKGVFWAYEMRGNAIPSGCDILYWGNIPNGAGLSSSASIEVLTACMIRDVFTEAHVDQVELAVLGQRAESKFVGVACGIMDQFASAMGKKDNGIFLDTDRIKYEYVPLRFGTAKIVLTNSKVKHSLAASAYNTRRQECEKALKKLKNVANINFLCDLGWDQFESYKDVIMNDVLVRRARHAVYENSRTIRAVNALRVNNIRRFGTLMNESHKSMRDDYEVSCPEIDYLVELAQGIEGVYGSRMTGGGFGGCTVSLVEEAVVPEFEETLGKKYKEKYGLDADFYVVEAGDGARELKM